MKVELKSLQVHLDMSEETNCFTAALWLDGVRVGRVSNHGTGGPDEFDIDRKHAAKFKAFEEWVKALPPLKSKYSDDPLPMNAELYIGGLVERHLVRKQVQRWVKAHTTFRLKGDKPGEWRTIKGPPNDRHLGHLRATHGDNLEIIANVDVEKAVDLEIELQG